MPIYEYRCEACGRDTEALQRLDDPPLTECPHCGGALRKLISAPAFQFKGSGWYVTDYARKGREGGSKGGGEAEKGSAKADGEAAKGADKKAKSADKSGSAKG